MKALVIAEKEKAARELCAGARSLAAEVVLIALGAQQVITGVADKVVQIDLPEGTALDDSYESVIALIGSEAVDVVFVEPTIRLKALVGRVAARFETSVITDVITLVDGVAANRYFGGIAFKQQKASGKLVLYTVAPGVFADLEASGTDVVEQAAYVAPPCPLKVVALEEKAKSEINLNDAKRIIAAGRGFTAEEDLGLARGLAQRIGAEIGCTRPLTEIETWFPKELYIGVSGLMLTPELYVGIGTSGQMQHMVGVDSAKVIVAINKDKNAPIFKQADIGLIGDLYQVLPKVNAVLDTLL
jgi:electron transfer flavoprotein alpha subunit